MQDSNVKKLIGYSVIQKRDTNEVVGYRLFFEKNELSPTDFGVVVDSYFAWKAVINEKLSIGSFYKVFTAYDSQSKRELFAGIVLAE